jgi:pyruvate dehydrogenase E1 component
MDRILRRVDSGSGLDARSLSLRRLEEHAKELGLLAAGTPYSAYRNTIPLERQGPYPGHLALEERLTSIMPGMRWPW